MSASTGLTSRGKVLLSDLHQFIPLEKLHSKEDTVKRLLHENSKQVSNWVFLSGWSEAVPPSLHSDGVVESLGFPKVPPLSLWSSLAPRETSASEVLPWAQNLIYCPGHLFQKPPFGYVFSCVSEVSPARNDNKGHSVLRTVHSEKRWQLRKAIHRQYFKTVWKPILGSAVENIYS